MSDLWYTLNGTGHRVDREATNARGGGGILARCGASLAFYGVTPKLPASQTACADCEPFVDPGADPNYEDEFTNSPDDAVDMLIGRDAPAKARAAMRAKVLAHRQEVCTHQGRTYTDEDADGRQVIVCSQCDIELMTEPNEDGGVDVSAAQ